MKPEQIEDLRIVYATWKNAESKRAAAKVLGIPRSTFRRKLNQAITYFEESGFETNILPDDELTTDQLLEYKKLRFKKKQEAKEARKWIPVKIMTNEPVGLLWIGDPHIDDDGCDILKLEEHMKLIRETQGLRSVSLGDITNNWVGRLSRLYDKQSTTAKQAWKLVEEWFIRVINPLLLIAGNHDMWSGAGDPIQWMKQTKTIYEDWRANIEFVFPNGKTCRAKVAHDLPGSSIWNELHAQKREAAMSGGSADVYISGHRHQWGLAQTELENGRVVWLARARGYKYHDPFAVHHGKKEQENGQAILQVIDPSKDGTNFVTCFADPEEGADYLTWKRRNGKAD